MNEQERLNHIIKVLKEVVSSGCQQSIATGQHRVTLRETKAAAKGRLDEIHIGSITEPIALFFPDKARPMLCGFLAEGNTQKACDAILATHYDGIGYLIVCEMKSGGTKGLAAQIRNTACFVELLVNLAFHHHDLDLSQWQRRYVVLCAGRLHKSKTRVGEPKAGLCPSRPKEISVRNKAELPIGALCSPIVKNASDSERRS